MSTWASLAVLPPCRIIAAAPNQAVPGAGILVPPKGMEPRAL